MTQASLSPDLQGALGAPPSIRDTSTRPAGTSEGALWMIALMSTGLVVAALLLLGLLLRNVVTDASLGGFVAGIGVVIAALGVGGVSYALVTARRAGYLELAVDSRPSASVAVPVGMRAVPALPPDLGRLKRRQLEAERASRSRQAKAIATATAVSANRPRTAPQRPATRASAPVRTAPRPPQQRIVRTAPPRAARPLPPRPAALARVAVVPQARPQMPVRPTITMPRTHVQSPRPAAWPNRAPVVRMPTPSVRPRTHAAMFQVNATNVRVVTAVRPR